jgi:SSS family solute:Na+ symporter
MVWRPVHFVIAAIYFVGLIVVGLVSGRGKGDSNQYLNATAAIPVWACALACIAANCGSLEVVSMMALGAQYGILACHFYWIGAIPALLVVAFWLLPVYKRSGAPTILDFIGKHYGEETQSLVAVCMAAMMMLIAGVSLSAFSQLMVAFVGWSFLKAVLIAAPVVLFYTWTGGFRATIYSELLHFTLVLAAVVPLLFLMIAEKGSVHNFLGAIPASRLHSWQAIPLAAPHAPMDRIGLVFGLGLVLSFSYWSTDFVQMQRALAVRRAQDAPFVPLSIGAAKFIFALLIVLPGVAAPFVLSHNNLAHNWNGTLPALMLHYYQPVWLVIGFMGLAASLVSAFSNNIAGFTSAWVQGIYQRLIRPRATDAHYTRVSRLTNAAAVVLSIGAASFALHFGSFMEYIQLVLSTFNAPLFALVFLAAAFPGRASRGGFAGFLTGLAVSIGHQVLVLTGLLHYGSQMAANFYGAMLGFSAALAGSLVISKLRSAATPADTVPAVITSSPGRVRWTALTAGCGIAVLFVIFNWIFW